MPTGPSTTTNPYIIGLEPNVTITSIITTGDALAGSTTGVFGGVPDGIGMFDNGNGTVTILVNHEIVAADGVVRDHGAKGAYIDRLIVDKATLQVISGDDAMKEVYLWNSATQTYDLSTSTAFSRFCSGDLANQTAFYNASTGLGTGVRIYMTGEETGAEGKPIAVISSGVNAGKTYELAALGNTSFENLVANPFAQNKTIVAATNDTSPGGQVYIYVGDKQATGLEIEKAGLTNGKLYGIKVAGITAETSGSAISGTFTLDELGPDGHVKDMNGAQINAEADAEGVTRFLRPEDSAWDPENPNVLYFNTTNSFTGPSRLYKATFTDITHPELGGTIEAVLDGTEGQKMLDNLTVGNGHVITQEDPGNNAYIAQVYDYDIASDTKQAIAKFDPALFTPGLAGFLTQDEESSGLIDVTRLFGDANHRAYLIDAQVHKLTGDPATVEMGQLLLMKVAKVQDGNDADNRLNGDGFANVIKGFGGYDVIRGGSGNDVLDGGALNDKLFGDNGDDTLIGGVADDTLTGGAGNDTFYYVTSNDSVTGQFGRDHIKDFTHGADHLVFDSRLTWTEKHADFDKDGQNDDTRLYFNANEFVELLNTTSIQEGDIVTVDHGTFMMI